ncbi:MAG: hypothetical protein KDE32_03905 [Novosphingobium sp.]|nr:hypothetical protein [Novosphingobium sp.]
MSNVEKYLEKLSQVSDLNDQLRILSRRLEASAKAMRRKNTEWFETGKAPAKQDDTAANKYHSMSTSFCKEDWPKQSGIVKLLSSVRRERSKLRQIWDSIPANVRQGLHSPPSEEVI